MLRVKNLKAVANPFGGTITRLFHAGCNSLKEYTEEYLDGHTAQRVRRLFDSYQPEILIYDAIKRMYSLQTAHRLKFMVEREEMDASVMKY